jgi:hypothetical protein
MDQLRQGRDRKAISCKEVESDERGKNKWRGNNRDITRAGATEANSAKGNNCNNQTGKDSGAAAKCELGEGKEKDEENLQDNNALLFKARASNCWQ